MKKKQITASLTVMCALLGIIIGIQYNTVKAQAQKTDSTRLTELSASLKQVQEENAALQSQLDKQQELLKSYESGEVTSAAIENLQKENANLRSFAGLTQRTGEGLVITMQDSSLDMGGDKNAYLIHAEDILQVVNELWVAGAEAVSINEQRVVSVTGITCAGSVITVNGVRVAAPFEIKAIGDSSVLLGAMKFPGGVVDNLAPWGIVIDMKEEKEITIPAYTQTALWQQNTQGETEEQS